MVKGRVLEQAVIQVEYVSFLSAGLDTAVHFLVDLSERALLHNAVVHVPLKRNLMTESSLARRQIDAAADAQHVCARRHHKLDVRLFLCEQYAVSAT